MIYYVILDVLRTSIHTKLYWIVKARIRTSTFEVENESEALLYFELKK